MRFIMIATMAASAFMAKAQWSTTPLDIVPQGTRVYEIKSATAPEGLTWSVLSSPTTAPEAQIVTYRHAVQAFDVTGNRIFSPEGLTFASEPGLSYTLENQLLLVDRDGNAIAVSPDCRHFNPSLGLLTYNIYKISPDGEMLWGDDGVSIDRGIGHTLDASMRIVQSPTTGYYIFAWTHTVPSGNTVIEMQQLDADGTPLWDSASMRITDSDGVQYPYLVNSTDGDIILVYARGKRLDLYARRIDSDGNDVWGDDVCIYNGGWNRTPLWTKLDIRASGDGGVIASWDDDRDKDMRESVYVTYLTSDGKLGFTATSADGGVRVSSTDYDAFHSRVLPTSDGNGFIALWNETDASQNYHSLRAQRLNKTGRAVWDGEPVELTPMVRMDISEAVPAYADGNDMALYYTEEELWGTGDKHIYVQLFDQSTGAATTQGGRFALRVSSQSISGLSVDNVAGSKCWIASWKEGDTNSESVQYLVQRLNHDLTFQRPTAIVAVSGGNDNPMRYEEGSLVINDLTGTHVTVTLRDMQGRTVTTLLDGIIPQEGTVLPVRGIVPGIYTATLATPDRQLTLKLAIR